LFCKRVTHVSLSKGPDLNELVQEGQLYRGFNKGSLTWAGMEQVKRVRACMAWRHDNQYTDIKLNNTQYTGLHSDIPQRRA